MNFVKFCSGGGECNKVCRQNKTWLKLNKSSRHFTWRPTCIKGHIGY